MPQPHPFQLSDFPLKSRSSKKSLGTLENILHKSETCPFCSLVIKSVTNPEDGDNPPGDLLALGAVCFLNWEIDGREAIRGPDGLKKSRTRRIHLSWSDSSLEDSYLVFVAPERYLRPNSDAQYVWGDEALFLGRNIDHEGGNRALIKSWLDLCCKAHGGQCAQTYTVERHGEFGDMISQSYFGVVDVYNMQLTSLPYEVVNNMVVEEPGCYEAPEMIQQSSGTIVHKPYVALSHVWGKGKSYTTTLENIMLHRSHGGLEGILADLPVRHAFRDAIDIAQGLGIQYMWIDSLCIVQDSTRSWNLNSRVMDLIYGNATLTICAADGQDSSIGLKAMHAKEHDNHQYIKECVPGVRLMVSRPPEVGIKASTWDKRAWTFQERILSKRCLIFTAGRVYFQCLSTGMSEDIVADKQGAGWSLDLVRAPLQTLRELEHRALWVYANFVPLYTSRNLTKPKDILAAFNGICNRMRETLQAPFIFGLPSSHFDLALLWEPEQALERRRPRDDSEDEKAKYKGMEFPSWSWCGWIGGRMEYNASMVDGSLANVHEWLMNHTWIHWYIRNGHGNLRPIWDGAKAMEDKSSEKRWRGYRSRRGHEKKRHNVDMNTSPSISLHQGSDDDCDNDYDDYGRTFRREIAPGGQHPFRQTLPENPYRVVMSEYSSETDKEFPDQPILQFWTWHTFLHLIPCDRPVSRPEKGLCRYDIADQIGDWCGSLMFDDKWIKDSNVSQHEFIAISDAKAFTKEECGVWTYYIPEERDQSEWGLYYVLLVKRHHVKWERVALGKVFKTAFANSEWKEIILG